jgi:hypothetical protein
MPLLDPDRLARPRTRGIAPCADDVVAKANAVALVSAPVPTRTRIPGQGCRRRPGIARLSVTRTPLLPSPCRLRTYTYTSKGRASTCPGSRTHRPTPTRSTAPPTGTGRCATTTPTCRLPSSANRRPSTTRSPPSTTSTLVAGSGRPRRRGSRSPPPLPARSANACTTCEQSRLFPRPATRPSRWSRSTSAPG